MEPTPDDVLIDLIAIDYGDERCVLGVAAVNGKATQIAKVPLAGACAALAPLFFAALPGRWEDEADCLTDLITIHVRNLLLGSNSAGQPYPLRVSLPSS